MENKFLSFLMPIINNQKFNTLSKLEEVGYIKNLKLIVSLYKTKSNK
jgi:hypothetical protein